MDLKKTNTSGELETLEAHWHRKMTTATEPVNVSTVTATFSAANNCGSLNEKWQW